MITAIVQDRVNSTRFYNKIFLDLCGRPLIWHIINRLKYSKHIDNIIIATTDRFSDDPIVNWAHANNIDYFRGSENDLLERFFFTALKFGCNDIVRITADDPFKDPIVLDKVVEFYYDEELDFAYNNLPPSFPEGLDVEVFSFKALKKAYNESNDLFEKEHMTQYFYRNPDKFKQSNYSYHKNYSHLRWTLDTPLDYEMVKKIYDGLYGDNEIFYMEDILQFLDHNPAISLINQSVKRSEMYK